MLGADGGAVRWYDEMVRWSNEMMGVRARCNTMMVIVGHLFLKMLGNLNLLNINILYN